MKSKYCFLVGLFFLLAGCVTVDQRAGFGDVSALVEERSNLTIEWNAGTELDAQAAQKVRDLLKDKLTVDKTVQVALLNNRSLQATYSNLGVAQADLVQAGLLRNPIFDAGVSFPLEGGRSELELGAALDFLDIFYMPLRKRLAGARFEEAKLRVTGAVLDFAGSVSASFYRHQANEQMVELRQTIAQALATSLEVARRLHQAGNISDLDLARERVLSEEAKLEFAGAEVAARQSREELNELMGLWGNDLAWEIDSRLPDIPAQPANVEDLERTAVRRSLELARARQAIIVEGEKLGFVRATALLPDLEIGALGEREEGEWEVGPTVEFPLPLFDQGQAQIGRSVSGLRRAQQEYYSLAVRVRSSSRSVRDRLRAARDRVLFYRDILLPLREQIVNETQLQYNAMQLGVFALVRSREQQIEAAAGYIDAVREYWLARNDLNQIYSGRLPAANGVPAEQRRGQKNMNEREGH